MTIPISLFLLFIGLLAICLLAVWIVPRLMIPKDLSDSDRTRIELQNEVRKTVAQIVLGLLVLVGAYNSYREYLISQDKQVTDRFTAAIGQLSAQSDAVRTGAVSALRRILRDSPIDRASIIAVLRAYIRSKAGRNCSEPDRSWKPDLEQRSPDVQLALEALAPPRDPQKPLGCSEADPVFVGSSVYLADIDLRGAGLGNANLEAFILQCADLNAHLKEANLRWAYLAFAWLDGASLQKAHLEGANLYFAHLNSANLEGACLNGAKLYGADFSGACLKEATLDGADLSRAHLQGVKGLTRQQLSRAVGMPADLPQESDFPSCQ